jgi:hypothetical protein
MSWGRIDDKLHDSRKFFKVHDKKHPVSVWLHCLSWALGPSGRSEPGVIPKEVALRFGAPSSIAKLVAVGLWTEIDDDQARANTRIRRASRA